MMAGAVEGELRQRIICNLCQCSETIASIVPEEWRPDVEDLIKKKPEVFWPLIREWAFEKGWLSFPSPTPWRDPAPLDLCPTCAAALRRMAADG